MRDASQLRLTREEQQDLRILLQRLNRLQEKSQAFLYGTMESAVPPPVFNNIDLLEFQELNKSYVDRSTEGGIVNDDRQKFLRYIAAISLVTKSTEGEEQELSSQLGSVLSNITSLMTKVLQENRISPYAPEGLSGLRERLDNDTRQFLEIFGESNKENHEDETDHNPSDSEDAVVSDVRNYVIMKDFGGELLLFKRDLAHLIAQTS